MKIFRELGIGLAALVASTSLASGQDWVNAVFPDRSFDAGTVARGSKIHHNFRLVNTTDREIHIREYKTKCGCTEVKLGANTIPPGTQTVIEAVLDTTKFTGVKASGLALVLDRPELIEVDLALNCFIRSDIVLNPGVADFGIVNRVSKPTIEMVLTYAGPQADWAITRMQTQTNGVSAKVSEQGRSSGSTAVNYLLSVTLNPAAPTGFFKDEVSLFTNDRTSPTIPVSVTANVQSSVSVTPGVVMLGQVRAGEAMQKTVLVRSNEAFRVTSIKSSRPELETPATVDGAKGTHPVAIRFKAPKEAGPFFATLDFETDVKDEPAARVNVFATVVP